MEIGVDIEQVERFKNLKSSVILRCFSQDEILYANACAKSDERLCGMWCAKEAAVKALGGEDVSYIDIEVCHKESGQPYIKRSEKIDLLLKKFGAKEIKVSISHTRQYAVATCIIC